jgi:hypothetical protein
LPSGGICALLVSGELLDIFLYLIFCSSGEQAGDGPSYRVETTGNQGTSRDDGATDTTGSARRGLHNKLTIAAIFLNNERIKKERNRQCSDLLRTVSVGELELIRRSS